MDLYLHFGIYKTGSSYLQTNAARNRLLLLKEGYYFPESIREKDMIAGRISPGNGNGLAKYLMAQDRGKMKLLLKKWQFEAQGKNCNRILISDEALIHGFAIIRSIVLLNEVLVELGFKKIYCLGFFRNPIDHCLSTLKHRAKKGTIADFEEWILNKYETYDVIENFLESFQKVPFEWDFRNYQSDGKRMADYFFKEWLHIRSVPPYSDIIVNPSLTLSELSMLSAIGKVDKRLVKYVYKGFLGLKPAEKANDEVFNHYCRDIAQVKLNQKYKVIQAFNNVLKEPLAASSISDNFVSKTKPGVQMNEHQMHALSASIKKAYKPANYSKDNLLSVYKYFKRIFSI